MANAQEKRRAARLQHPFVVAYRTGESFVSAFAVNLSGGGLFINTATPLEVGSALEVLLSLPGETGPLTLKARVMRVMPAGSDSPGMGVEFLHVTPEQRAHIQRFVDSLRLELPDDGSRPPRRGKQPREA